jgi:predicted GNAT family acetyltransferase
VPVLRSTPVRVLDDRDIDAALAVVQRDPVANVLVASRLSAVGANPRRLAAELWGYVDDGELVSLCYAGANLVPVEATEEAARAFALRARRQGRRCASIVGPAAAVDAMWRELEPTWGPARDIRTQPLLAIDRPSFVAGDVEVRRVLLDEVDAILPACIAMFTEEVGVSPVGSDGGALYRARVTELVAQGRSFARLEDGGVLFKAEIGAVSPQACQVQGVWVEPALRGGGLGTAGMATVVDTALREVAPVVSLYVNEYNYAARAAYERVGFKRVGTFVSVLF